MVRGDENPDVYGHEFGHIIQTNNQGWAWKQSRGIWEQFLDSFINIKVYEDRKYNEGAAELWLQNLGGCTNYDDYGKCIKVK